MTCDRSYTLAKEYKNKIILVAENNGFKAKRTNEIEVEKIERSVERNIKIKIQKTLSKINLMTYGYEFGESTVLISEGRNGFLDCKAWCLDDYLIELEIAYKNIEDDTFLNLKRDFAKQFVNCKIKWTRLSDK